MKTEDASVLYVAGVDLGPESRCGECRASPGGFHIDVRRFGGDKLVRRAGRPGR